MDENCLRFNVFSCTLITNFECTVNVAFSHVNFRRQKFSFHMHMVRKTGAESRRQKMESIYGAGFWGVCHAAIPRFRIAVLRPRLELYTLYIYSVETESGVQWICIGYTMCCVSCPTRTGVILQSSDALNIDLLPIHSVKSDLTVRYCFLAKIHLQC